VLFDWYVHAGKLCSGEAVAAEYVDFPGQVKIVDLAMAASYTLALTQDGDVYFWGKHQVCVQEDSQWWLLWYK
jgi:alpha-tubulin suppressor-like RCC1 family protein